MPTPRSRLVTAALFTLGLLVAGGSGNVASAAAVPCDLQSLDGSFGVKFDGHSQTLGRFASVSIWTFDGKGRLKASELLNSDVTGPDTRTIEGTYSVLSSCGFIIRFPSTLAANHEAIGGCVLVDGGKEFYCMDVEAGWVATAVGKKI
jgi:hypothetical protein